MRTRVASAVPALLAAALLAGCGGDDDPGASDSSSTATSSTATSSTATSSPSVTPPGDDGSGTPSTGGDGGTDGTDAPPFPANTEPDTGAPSQDAFVTVTGIRTGAHDGYDRVVFDIGGAGTPGWDVRYVPEATSQGSGAAVPVRGEAILQVTLSGVGYPTETGIEEVDGSVPVPGNGTETVTEVVWDTTFEGTSVAFVGLAAQTPFRVYLLEGPARVVVDVVHPG